MIRFTFIRYLIAGLFCLAVPKALNAQTITTFTPQLGQVSQLVTIWGNGFYNGPTDTVNQVWFGDILLPNNGTWFFVLSDSQITAYVPPGAVDAPISVKRPSGVRVYSSTDFNVIGPEPYITGFTPNIGQGFTAITIEGVQFQGNVTAVKINGTNVHSAFVQSDTTISAVAQADVTTGPITVVGFGTGSNTTTELFYVAPVISGFSPASGRAGETLTVDGINFTDASSVRIGSVPLPVFTVNGNTQIVATVASDTVSGKVIVVTPGGQFQTTTNFTVLPSISGFSPATGTTNTVVTISGANLNVAPVSVLFNGVAAAVTSSSFSQIVATAPASSSGPIKVTTGDGSATSSAIFSYPPSITSFSPGAGGAGTLVNISGSSFTNATEVLFNNVSALFFTVNNNSLIQAAAPNNVSSGLLKVRAPGGVTESTAVFYAPATFTGFLPSEGLPGTDVILFGSNFEGATQVKFNATTAPILSNTGSQIGTKVPTNATSGTITITTPAGTVTSASVFTVPGISDLRVNTFLHVPEPVTVGEDLTLTIVPSNDGPNTASNVTASVTVAPGLTVKSASTQKGTVNTSGNPVVFSIGSMSLFENPTLTLVLIPQVGGPVTNTVTLSSSTFDPNTGNNSRLGISTVIDVAELSIDKVGGNQIRVAWPASLTGFVLQSTLILTNGTIWGNVPTTPVVDGDEKTVTEPSTGAAKYYRLKK